MESNHTPGPWGIDINSVGEYLISAGPIGTPVDYLAVITNRKRSKANARLIAAAPEMLEALTGLVEWMDISGLSKTRDGGFGVLAYKGTEYGVVTKAREAIAKAKGE